MNDSQFVIRKIVREQSCEECDVIGEMRAVPWFGLGSCVLVWRAASMNCGYSSSLRHQLRHKTRLLKQQVSFVHVIDCVLG